MIPLMDDCYLSMPEEEAKSLHFAMFPFSDLQVEREKLLKALNS